MKISLSQLLPQLKKSLAMIYVISGDEILLVDETIALIRDAAKKQGFDERIRIPTDSSSEWGKLLFANINSYSLFANKRILELDLTEIKFNAANGKILQEIANQFSAQSREMTAADFILVVRAQKLDARTEQAAWYKALEKTSTIVQIWPISSEQLPQWIMQRAHQSGLTLEKSAADFLALQCEGNLLSAAQTIAKLQLLGIKNIDLDMVRETTTDDAQFDIFSLVESAVASQSQRCIRIIHHLAKEKTEPTLILWALTREIRLLHDIAVETQKGAALASVFAKHRIWEKRKAPMISFLKRHSTDACLAMLTHAAKIDRIIKGVEPGNIWDGLQDLTLTMGSTM